MASSVFEGCAVDLSFAETEFKSAGNILSLKKLLYVIYNRLWSRYVCLVGQS